MGAALGDLQVGECLAGETKRGNLRLDPGPRDADPFVDTGECVLQLRIALRVASRDNDALVLSATLQLEGSDDFALRLFAGGRDKRTGVDDDGVRTVGIRRERETRLEEIAGTHLKIDGVLGAAKGNKGYRLLVSHFPTMSEERRPTSRSPMTNTASDEPMVANLPPLVFLPMMMFRRTASSTSWSIATVRNGRSSP